MTRTFSFFLLLFPRSLPPPLLVVSHSLTHCSACWRAAALALSERGVRAGKGLAGGPAERGRVLRAAEAAAQASLRRAQEAAEEERVAADALVSGSASLAAAKAARDKAAASE